MAASGDAEGRSMDLLHLFSKFLSCLWFVRYRDLGLVSSCIFCYWFRLDEPSHGARYISDFLVNIRSDFKLAFCFLLHTI